MENISSAQNNEGLDHILWRIENVADWLKHEAEKLDAEPPEPEKRDTSVRRYKDDTSPRLQRRPTYMLRGM